MILQIAIDDLETSNQQACLKVKEQINFALGRKVIGVLFKCPKCPAKLKLLASLIEPYLLDLWGKEKQSDFVIYIELDAVNTDTKDPWRTWNEFRCRLPANEQVKLVLNLSHGYPTDPEVERWAGEPVGIVRHTIIKSATKNKAPFYLNFIRFLKPIAQKREIALLIDGYERTHYDLIEKCLKVLRLNIQDAFLTSSPFKHTCDNPSAPLQPLRDNLEHSEYEIFEEDRIKYSFYYYALVDAMAERVDSKEASLSSASSSIIDSGLSSDGSSSPERIHVSQNYAFKKPLGPYEKGWINYDLNALIEPAEISSDCQDSSRTLTVVVAGAGRGPLVTATLLAANVAKIAKITVHVIEKNPNVIQCLEEKVHSEWLPMHSDASILIHQIDMRIENITDFIQEDVDIVVSELLGSFGDNELSPECLGALLSHLNRDVICIPQSYSSYIQPIMSYKGHCKLQQLAIAEGQPPEAYLTSYHSMLFRNYYAAAPTLEVWRFNHYPLSIDREANPYLPTNTITGECEFTSSLDFLCHGFAGYFTATLYGSVRLSTRPENHTKNLPSWYPIYFPLVKPMFVEAGRRIVFRITRSINPDETVAYKWQAFVGETSDQVAKDAATFAS